MSEGWEDEPTKPDILRALRLEEELKAAYELIEKLQRTERFLRTELSITRDALAEARR